MSSQSSPKAFSSSRSRWRYDVFLSFCGTDNSKDFTDHLHTAMQQRDIIVFKEDERLVRGEYVNDGLLKAVEESEYAVVVISENYAFSKACLMELATIMDCSREGCITVLPVFYHVNPSDGGKQNRKFGEAFDQHKANLEPNIDLWKNALEEVGDVTGWHIHDDSHASTVVEEICGSVVHEVRCNLPTVSSKCVGMKPRVMEMLSLLCAGSYDVRCVGIFGMGGIGKTTLAKVLYDRISSKFEISCFIENVGENYGDLLSLQRQLISEIFKSKDMKGSGPPKVSDTREGTALIEKGTVGKKVLIVLDDVVTEAQLASLKERSNFGSGSRILLTTRDKRLMLLITVDHFYEVGELNDAEAMELFSRKAFRQRYPKESFVELSKDVVDSAYGLPLAIESFGSLLLDAPMAAWRSTLDELTATVDMGIFDRLRISYDRLDEWLQNLFLDIACFFNGEHEKSVILKLESLDDRSRSGIKILRDRSLLKISGANIQMPPLLMRMGKHIVYGESPYPWQRSRLWQQEDIISVLENNIETHPVKSIFLKLPLSSPKQLSLESLSKLRGLRMLIIHPKAASPDGASDNEIQKDLQTVKWIGDPSKLILSNELCFLEWWGCPLQLLPTCFQRQTHLGRYARLYIRGLRDVPARPPAEPSL